MLNITFQLFQNQPDIEQEHAVLDFDITFTKISPNATDNLYFKCLVQNTSTSLFLVSFVFHQVLLLDLLDDIVQIFVRLQKKRLIV